MNKMRILAEQLHCPECGTVIPKGKSRCPNSQCPTNKPLEGQGKLSIKVKDYSVA